MEVVNPVEHLLLVQAILLEHWKSATQRAPSGLPENEMLSHKEGPVETFGLEFVS